MKKTRLFRGLATAILLDAASGLFWTHIMRKMRPLPYSYFSLERLGINLHIPVFLIAYGAGLFFGGFSDLDTILQKKLRGSVTAEHRSGLHYPMVVIPAWVALLSFLSLWWPFFQWLALLSMLCLFFHFLHDSIGNGGGIRWFWPFSKNHYQFLASSGGKRKIVSLWDPQEWPYFDVEIWLESFFLKPTVESLTGIIAFITVIILILVW